MRTVYSIYRLYIDCIHIRKVQKGKIEITDDTEDKQTDHEDEVNLFIYLRSMNYSQKKKK